MEFKSYGGWVRKVTPVENNVWNGRREKKAYLQYRWEVVHPDDNETVVYGYSKNAILAAECSLAIAKLLDRIATKSHSFEVDIAYQMEMDL